MNRDTTIVRAICFTLMAIVFAILAILAFTYVGQSDIGTYMIIGLAIEAILAVFAAYTERIDYLRMERRISK